MEKHVLCSADSSLWVFVPPLGVLVLWSGECWCLRVSSSKVVSAVGWAEKELSGQEPECHQFTLGNLVSESCSAATYTATLCL